MKLFFLRRKFLGASSVRGMASFINEESNPRGVSATCYTPTEGDAGIVRSDKPMSTIRDFCSPHTLMIRWGCSSNTGFPLDRQVNPSSAIKKVADKLNCRMELQRKFPTMVPPTITNELGNPHEWPLVLRPKYHSRGINLFVVNSMNELLTTIRDNEEIFRSGWYASKLINKKEEYRVYVVQGKVVSVARKYPDNPDDIAWNVSQGGTFKVVRWGDWPLNVVEAAICAHNSIEGLDFSGVDVMVDQEGFPYIIELNSAPSLKFLSDGSISYRQKCMAKAFMWMANNGKDPLPTNINYNTWRDYIHPSILG